jgi:hypothetical protein
VINDWSSLTLAASLFLNPHLVLKELSEAKNDRKRTFRTKASKGVTTLRNAKRLLDIFFYLDQTFKILTLKYTTISISTKHLNLLKLNLTLTFNKPGIKHLMK